MPIDDEKIAKWIDDRLVQFVQTYLSLHENQYYLKEHMVEDPVAHVRFPKFAAGATLESGGQNALLHWRRNAPRVPKATQRGQR